MELEWKDQLEIVCIPGSQPKGHVFCPSQVLDFSASSKHEGRAHRLCPTIACGLTSSLQWLPGFVKSWETTGLLLFHEPGFFIGKIRMHRDGSGKGMLAQREKREHTVICTWTCFASQKQEDSSQSLFALCICNWSFLGHVVFIEKKQEAMNTQTNVIEQEFPGEVPWINFKDS